MIIFLTTSAFRNVLQSLAGPAFGAELPEVRIAGYEDALRRQRLPIATYIFCDLERLSNAELRAVSFLHVALAAAGMNTLNNPARVKQRYELLRELAGKNVNSFNVYRADDQPRPARFPVFIRLEDSHTKPSVKLLQNQGELDAELSLLQQLGEPLKGMLVVECVPSDRLEGRWHKWGAFCIGGEPVLDHVAVDDSWMVKTGRWEQLTPTIVEEEHRAVAENRHAAFVRKMFEIACIDFGRADFALAGGRPMLFEINTNPAIYDFRADPHILRQDTMKRARRNFAAALLKLDTPRRGVMDVPLNPLLAACRSQQAGTTLCPRF